MTVSAFLGYYSMKLLVKSSDISGQFSYQDLAIVTHGKKFELFVKIVFFLSTWSNCIIYTILVHLIDNLFHIKMISLA